MHPGPGFRLRSDWERPPRAVIDGFREFETPAISDQMNRLYTMEPAIRVPTDPQARLIGPALTVKVFPGDNLMVHKSLDIAKPGDVIVVDAGSSTMNAVLGDLISTKARHRGVAGFIVDGLIRDLPAILELGDFPVFDRGGHRRLDPVRRIALAGVARQVRAAQDHRDRVCLVASGSPWGGAVSRLEHANAVADVQSGDDAQAADQAGSEVAEDVAVLIR